VAVEIKRQLSVTQVYDRTVANNMLRDLERYKSSEEEACRVIADHTSQERTKRIEIQSFRNNPSPRAIETLLTFAGDSSRSEELRIIALETLGWYLYSHRKADIVTGLNKIIGSKPSQAVVSEAQKSINRL
jgi:hypothetical protein